MPARGKAFVGTVFIRLISPPTWRYADNGFYKVTGFFTFRGVGIRGKGRGDSPELALWRRRPCLLCPPLQKTPPRAARAAILRYLL